MSTKKKVVISGASRGIGKAIALELVGESTEFAFLGTNQESLDLLVKEINAIGSSAKGYAFNLKDTSKNGRF